MRENMYWAKISSFTVYTMYISYRLAHPQPRQRLTPPNTGDVRPTCDVTPGEMTSSDDVTMPPGGEDVTSGVDERLLCGI